MSKDAVYALADPNYQQTAWYQKSLEGLEANAARRGLSLHLIPSQPEERSFRRAHCVILIGADADWTRYQVSLLRAAGVKSLLVGPIPSDFGEDVSGPVLDRRTLMEKMLLYFRAAGRLRLASVGGTEGNINDEKRAEIFLQTARLLGLKAGEKDSFTAKGDIASCVERFLDRAEDYDGALCVNDAVAVHLIARARERKLPVPEKLFVAGSGDFILGRMIRPTLTSSTLDYREMGSQAVNIWCYLRKNPSVEALRLSIPCVLIPRGSTAFCPEPDYGELKKAAKNPPALAEPDGVYMKLTRLENCLESADALDMAILNGVVRGDSTERIAESQFVSQGTVHYRLRKLYRALSADCKAALKELLAPYWNDPESP